jgi:hypothetical protein
MDEDRKFADRTVRAAREKFDKGAWRRRKLQEARAQLRALQHSIDIASLLHINGL